MTDSPRPRKGRPQSPQSNPAVRRASLNKAFERFNEDIGSKTARLIAEFHMAAVEPRLLELEMRWYQRLWRLLRWAWESSRLGRLFWWVVRGLRLDRFCRWVVGKLRLDRAWNWLGRASQWAWRKIRRVPPEETLPYKVTEAVRTTEKGVALFDGEPQTGVVTKVTKDRVWVRCPGMEEAQEFSPSVWESVETEVEPPPVDHAFSPSMVTKGGEAVCVHCGAVENSSEAIADCPGPVEAHD